MNDQASEPHAGHELTPDELLEAIRARLGLSGSGRRIGAAHVAVLQVLIERRGSALAVNAIHLALVARGDPIKLSGVYRVLDALEEAHLVECQWRISAGRPMRVFGVAPGLLDGAVG